MLPQPPPTAWDYELDALAVASRALERIEVALKPLDSDAWERVCHWTRERLRGLAREIPF